MEDNKIEFGINKIVYDFEMLLLDKKATWINPNIIKNLYILDLLDKYLKKDLYSIALATDGLNIQWFYLKNYVIIQLLNNNLIKCLYTSEGNAFETKELPLSKGCKRIIPLLEKLYEN